MSRTTTQGDRIERCSCRTNFGARYRARLQTAANVRVLIRATVTHLRTSPDGVRIHRLDGRNHNGTGFSVNGSLYENLPFDYRKDFDPVFLVSLVPNILVVTPSVPAGIVRTGFPFSATS